MSISAQVRDYIAQLNPGTVFLLNDISSYGDARKATSRAMHYYLTGEKQPSGSVRKIADGLYYKEKIGLLGKLPPSYDDILHALLYREEEQVGYVVGHQLFYQLGLSTQMPATVSVITSKLTPTFIDFAGVKIEVLSKKQKIDSKDIKLMQLAYVLNNIDKVQSLEGEIIYSAFGKYFEHLVQNNIRFEKLYESLKYKRTKALFGALLEHYQKQSQKDLGEQLEIISSDLSDRSYYHLGGISSFLNNCERWHIRP